MSTKDFNLDLVEVSKSNTGASARITSYSLCTPGCITGVLMGCQFQSAGCNVHVHVSKQRNNSLENILVLLREFHR